MPKYTSRRALQVEGHWPSIRLVLVVLLGLTLLAGPAARSETRVVDATGATVTVPAGGPVVSIGGAVTEIAYALGAAARIVAVDATSVYPPEVRGKANVGYMRRLAAEPILALEPALILAVADAGPLSVLEQLRASGVAVVLVPDEPSIQGVIRKVEIVSTALGAEREGKVLAARILSEFETLIAAVGTAAPRPRVLFLLSIGQGGAPLAGGRKTSADGIIRLAGGANAVDAFEGYKPLSPEAAVAARPEIILVTERSLDLLGGAEGLLALPEVAVTPAGQARRILSLDGLLLLGFGPRTGQAVSWLARELHPGLRLQPSPSD